VRETLSSPESAAQRRGLRALEVSEGALRRPHPLEELGVIDLGSNSARLAIYAAGPVGPPWTVYESKELPRLGTGLDARGRLTAAARKGALETLERFGKILDDRRVHRRAAVATGVMRQAENRARFLAEVRSRTRLPLRVISAQEEAYYAFLGVRSSLILGDDLLADLGGGTLQLLRVEGGEPGRALSLPLGALRMHQEFLHNDPPKRREVQELREFVDAALEASGPWTDPPPHRLVGVGGTFRAAGHLLEASHRYPLTRVHGLEIPRRFLTRESLRLGEMTIEERREVPGVSADRADILLAGFLVIDRLLRRLSLKRFTVSACGIREGLAQELLGRPAPQSRTDLAWGSARSMAWGFHLSSRHGERVQRLALELNGLLHDETGPHEETRLALSVAGILHDVGTVVSYPEHPAHSRYLVENHPLYGLTHREIVLASLAVAQHEGDELPSGALGRFRGLLKPDELPRVRRLGAILAIAESLAESRPPPQVHRKGDVLSFRVARGIPPAPRAFLRARRFFKRSFGLEVHLGVLR
jgi:exopolyphosphatase/guanosine-5'-triphosphate,3'-diphosphate pyrophosphatase